jgi:hypothetical protein
MRVEITIADERPEAKILSSISDPSAFVLDFVRRSGLAAKPNDIPNYAAAVNMIRQSPNFRTKKEIDAYIGELRNGLTN